MSKKEILKLTEYQYLINAINLYEKHYGSDDMTSEIKVRYKSLFDSYNGGFLTLDEYRDRKTGLAIALHRYISVILEDKETEKKNIVMNIHNQNIYGNANVADNLYIGGNQSNSNFDSTDNYLLKAIESLNPESKNVLIEAISGFNTTKEPIEKNKSKNKIVSFITDNFIPVLKVVGKTALGVVLAKYGLKLADFGVED